MAKKAKLTVATVRVACPHCGGILLAEGMHDHSETVFAEPGETLCEDCGKPFVIPHLEFVVGRSLRVDPRDWPTVD